MASRASACVVAFLAAGCATERIVERGSTLVERVNERIASVARSDEIQFAYWTPGRDCGSGYLLASRFDGSVFFEEFAQGETIASHEWSLSPTRLARLNARADADRVLQLPSRSPEAPDLYMDGPPSVFFARGDGRTLINHVSPRLEGLTDFVRYFKFQTNVVQWRDREDDCRRSWFLRLADSINEVSRRENCKRYPGGCSELAVGPRQER